MTGELQIMTSATRDHTLLGYAGSGSAIVECAFALAELPLVVEDIDMSPGSVSRARLLAHNPLAQVPVLLLPDDSVLSESLAILHYVQDLAPECGLIPKSGNDARATFYRWSVFLVAALYPTFTYGDDPRQWVDDEHAAQLLRQSTDEHRKLLWTELEATAQGPWFLGTERCAIDLYLAVMRHWRPGAAWFDAQTPKLTAVAQHVMARPALATIFARHFPNAARGG
jgi:GST-like protein